MREVSYRHVCFYRFILHFFSKHHFFQRHPYLSRLALQEDSWIEGYFNDPPRIVGFKDYKERVVYQIRQKVWVYNVEKNPDGSMRRCSDLWNKTEIVFVARDSLYHAGLRVKPIARDKIAIIDEKRNRTMILNIDDSPAFFFQLIKRFELKHKELMLEKAEEFPRKVVHTVAYILITLLVVTYLNRIFGSETNS